MLSGMTRGLFGGVYQTWGNSNRFDICNLAIKIAIPWISTVGQPFHDATKDFG